MHCYGHALNLSVSDTIKRSYIGGGNLIQIIRAECFLVNHCLAFSVGDTIRHLITDEGTVSHIPYQ